MFHMMNEARIGVGLGAVMLGYTGYLHALDYARERPQGRLPGGKDPAAAAGADHRACRRAAHAAGAEGVRRGRAGAVPVLRPTGGREPTGRGRKSPRDAGLLLDMLTPIVKAWPSQWCLEANNLAIQVHGGYGYTREYPVEQFYRDNRLNPIHEGTNGIQALDLLGRKVGMDGRRRRSSCSRARSTTVREAQACDSDELRRCGEALTDALDRVMEVTRNLLCVTDKGEVELALANAHVYLELAGQRGGRWIWLRQALVAVKKGRHRSRRRTGFLPGQAAGLRLLLPLGIAEDETMARIAGQPRSHHARDAGHLVLITLSPRMDTKDTKVHEERRANTRTHWGDSRDVARIANFRFRQCHPRLVFFVYLRVLVVNSCLE